MRPSQHTRCHHNRSQSHRRTFAHPFRRQRALVRQCKRHPRGKGAGHTHLCHCISPHLPRNHSHNRRYGHPARSPLVRADPCRQHFHRTPQFRTRQCLHRNHHCHFHQQSLPYTHTLGLTHRPRKEGGGRRSWRNPSGMGRGRTHLHPSIRPHLLSTQCDRYTDDQPQRSGLALEGLCTRH